MNVLDLEEALEDARADWEGALPVDQIAKAWAQQAMDNSGLPEGRRHMMQRALEDAIRTELDRFGAYTPDEIAEIGAELADNKGQRLCEPWAVVA